MTRHPAIRHLLALCVCLGVLVGGSSVLAAESAAPSGVIIVSPTGITRAVDVPTFPRRATLPVVDLSLSPSGRGYVTLDAGGTISSYGDAARFSRQSFPRALALPVAIVLTKSGRGAYVGFIDGTVRALGDATGVGGPAGGASDLVPPLVDIALSPDGEGLWALRANGSVDALGGAAELGGAPASSSPAVGIASTPTGEGAWVARLNGSVAALGDAQGARGARAAGEPRVSDIASLGAAGWALVDLAGRVEASGDSAATLPGSGAAFVAIDSLAAATAVTAGGQGAPTSTKVIAPPAVLATSGDPDGTLIVSLPCYVTGGAAPLQTGDVLAASIGEHTPDGLLRRVLAIGACSNGAVDVTTEPATLSDAIPEGSFDLSDDLSDVEFPDVEPTTQDGFVEEEPSPLVARPSTQSIAPSTVTAAAAVGTIAENRFRYGCPSDPDDSDPVLSVKPSYSLNPDVVFEADWDSDDAYVRIGLGLQGDLSIEASATGVIACDATFSILDDYSLGRRVFTVGPIPVVVEPEVSLAAKLEGKAELSLTATAEASGNASAILDSRTGFSGSALFTGDAEAEPAGELEVGFTLEPSIGFLLYGIVAPTAELESGFTAKIEPCTNPNVKVEQPVKLTAKIEPADWLGDLLDPISNIDFDVESEFELPGSPYLLYSAHLPIPPLPVPCEQTTTLPDGRVNEAYSQQLSIEIPDSANDPQYALAGGSVLPDGLSLSPSGLLAGTPESAGIYSFTVVVSHSLGSTSSFFQLTILPDSLQITTESLPSAQLDEPYSATLTANRPADELVWTIPSGDLPPGIDLDPDGTLSGTPTEAGLFSFTVRAQHTPTGGGGGTVEKPLSISVQNEGTGATITGSITHTPITDADCQDSSFSSGRGGTGDLSVSATANLQPDGTIVLLVTGGSYSYDFAGYSCRLEGTSFVAFADSRFTYTGTAVVGASVLGDTSSTLQFDFDGTGTDAYPGSTPTNYSGRPNEPLFLEFTVTRDGSGTPISLEFDRRIDGNSYVVTQTGSVPISQP